MIIEYRGGKLRLYPDYYTKSVKDIDINFLNENNIKGLLLDVDNTLIDYYKKIPSGVEPWANNLKQKGIKLCILSNSNDKKKVEDVANKLGIQYIYFAKKPLKSGFKRGQKLLQLESNNIAVVGDQIFTDVIGANRSNMFSILVDPIYAEKEFFITSIKRPFEKWIMKKYNKNRIDDKLKEGK